MPTPKHRAEKKKRRLEQREQWIADNGGTPYHGFAENEERLTERVAAAASAADVRLLSARSRYAPCGEYASWSKGGKGRPPQPLYVEDLAVGLWAVECVGNKGVSYGQLDRCFKECRGVGCHNNKSSAVFATLVKLNLIAKVGNYSASRRGNVYRVLQEGEAAPPPPKPMERPHADAELSKQTADDDPW